MSYDGRFKYDRQVAAAYDADRAGEAHWSLERQWLTRYSATRALGRVLDVPVGTGRLLEAMTSATHIVGVDASDAMLDIAMQAARSVTHCPVQLQKGDALSLGCPDGSFDTVVCFRLVHLLPPDLVEPLFRELRRVCAGRLVVQLYSAKDAADTRTPLRRVASRIKRALLRRGRAWAHIESFSHGEQFLTNCIEAAGFRIVKRDQLDRYDGSTVEVLELER